MYRVGDAFRLAKNGYWGWVERRGQTLDEDGRLPGWTGVADVMLSETVQARDLRTGLSLEEAAAWLWEKLVQDSQCGVANVSVGGSERMMGGSGASSRHWASRLVHFSASHEQKQLPESYACHRLHGHNYTARLLLSEVNTRRGGVGEEVFGAFRAIIAERLDHRHLNDVLGTQTSTEQVASWLAHAVSAARDGQSWTVEVGETPKIRAGWWGEDCYGISKRFYFAARHVDSDGAKGPQQGAEGAVYWDEYTAAIEMRRYGLDRYGFAFDLAELGPFETILRQEMEGGDLNARLGERASLECLARWLFERAKAWWPDRLYAVRVWNSDDHWAEFCVATEGTSHD